MDTYKQSSHPDIFVRVDPNAVVWNGPVTTIKMGDPPPEPMQLLQELRERVYRLEAIVDAFFKEVR